VGSTFATVIATPFKVAAVSCQLTVYTKILTPSGQYLIALLKHPIRMSAAGTHPNVMWPNLLP
jgi:hypothetical protein